MAYATTACGYWLPAMPTVLVWRSVSPRPCPPSPPDIQLHTLIVLAPPKGKLWPYIYKGTGVFFFLVLSAVNDRANGLASALGFSSPLVHLRSTVMLSKQQCTFTSAAAQHGTG